MMRLIIWIGIVLTIVFLILAAIFPIAVSVEDWRYPGQVKDSIMRGMYPLTLKNYWLAKTIAEQPTLTEAEKSQIKRMSEALGLEPGPFVESYEIDINRILMSFNIWNIIILGFLWNEILKENKKAVEKGREKIYKYEKELIISFLLFTVCVVPFGFFLFSLKGTEISGNTITTTTTESGGYFALGAFIVSIVLVLITLILPLVKSRLKPKAKMTETIS